MAKAIRIIEIIGEGKLDIGEVKESDKHRPGPPTSGVVPILVHKLCSQHHSLKVIRRRVSSLEKGGINRKVAFAKKQAFYNRSDGAVFVVDTEGDNPEKKREQLIAGREAKYPDFPMAVGVAHPCIETWLLVDARAIVRGMKLQAAPVMHLDPESLPAPRKNESLNPKTVLAQCAGSTRGISASEAAAIASHINDLEAVGNICRKGFRPFAEEVKARLAPLFEEPPLANEA